MFLWYRDISVSYTGDGGFKYSNHFQFLNFFSCSIQIIQWKHLGKTPMIRLDLTGWGKAFRGFTTCGLHLGNRSTKELSPIDRNAKLNGTFLLFLSATPKSCVCVIDGRDVIDDIFFMTSSDVHGSRKNMKPETRITVSLHRNLHGCHFPPVKICIVNV